MRHRLVFSAIFALLVAIPIVGCKKNVTDYVPESADTVLYVNGKTFFEHPIYSSSVQRLEIKDIFKLKDLQKKKLAELGLQPEQIKNHYAFYSDSNGKNTGLILQTPPNGAEKLFNSLKEGLIRSRPEQFGETKINGKRALVTRNPIHFEKKAGRLTINLDTHVSILLVSGNILQFFTGDTSEELKPNNKNPLWKKINLEKDFIFFSGSIKHLPEFFPYPEIFPKDQNTYRINLSPYGDAIRLEADFDFSNEADARNAKQYLERRIADFQRELEMPNALLERIRIKVEKNTLKLEKDIGILQLSGIKGLFNASFLRELFDQLPEPKIPEKHGKKQ